MITSRNPLMIIIACPLFLLGALSDYFDGWYARKHNIVSKWGIFIDPLADKFLTSSAFVAYAIMDIIPLWMVIIVTSRDFAITFLRLFADSHNMDIITSYSAKVKTFLQFVFIAYIQILLFFAIVIENPEFKSFLNYLLNSSSVYFMMLFLSILTVYTLLEYIKQNKKLILKLFGA